MKDASLIFLRLLHLLYSKGLPRLFYKIMHDSTFVFTQTGDIADKMLKVLNNSANLPLVLISVSVFVYKASKSRTIVDATIIDVPSSTKNVENSIARRYTSENKKSEVLCRTAPCRRGYRSGYCFDYCNNHHIKAKLKGLPPAIYRQQTLSVA